MCNIKQVFHILCLFLHICIFCEMQNEEKNLYWFLICIIILNNYNYIHIYLYYFEKF